MPYDIQKFRTVKHGVKDETADCRHCEFSEYDDGAAKKGYRHAKQTAHTVDVFREHHVEYTSYVKPLSNLN